MRQLLIGLLPVLWLFGCIASLDDRVQLDETTGFARIDTAQIEVTGQVASVRRFQDGLIELWAQAPVVPMVLNIKNSEVSHWDITVFNTMPNAVLWARNQNGEALPVGEPATPRPTVRKWRLPIPGGQTITLTITPPDAQLESPYRFAVLGDIQSAIDEFGDIVARLNQDPTIRFVASTGDLIERGTRRLLERFQSELHPLRVPFFSTVGNHELINADPSDWAELFGRFNTHFQFKGTAFTLIDSASATIHPKVYDWLDECLEEGRTLPHVALTHIPPLDPSGTRGGAFSSSKEAAKFIRTLAAGKVDATFYGHIHSYYEFSNGGIPAYISGGGGAIPERMDGISRHYLTVDVIPKDQSLSVKVVHID
ncbi:MAG: metallophosphoesterase [Proteobacteria bacterium]|nr:metallophosphoesterase [Pseudomonadota bacterium]